MTPSIFLAPVVALILWTFVVAACLYATRIPAMKKAGIRPQEAAVAKSDWRNKLPERANWVADNYNHLHEQPTVFYALMATLTLIEATSQIALVLAWVYVGLRILHSLIQMTQNIVILRFGIFMASTFVLFAMTLIAAMHVFGI